MSNRPQRSLRHEYELYVENEIEAYKESLPRRSLLKLGDEAVGALRDEQQLALTELVVWEEVDRIIFKRLRLVSYETWRRKRLKDQRETLAKAKETLDNAHKEALEKYIAGTTAEVAQNEQKLEEQQKPVTERKLDLNPKP